MYINSNTFVTRRSFVPNDIHSQSLDFFPQRTFVLLQGLKALLGTNKDAEKEVFGAKDVFYTANSPHEN